MTSTPLFLAKILIERNEKSTHTVLEISDIINYDELRAFDVLYELMSVIIIVNDQCPLVQDWNKFYKFVRENNVQSQIKKQVRKDFD